MYGLLLSLTKMMILRAVRLPASAWNRKYSILSVTFFYFMLTIIIVIFLDLLSAYFFFQRMLTNSFPTF